MPISDIDMFRPDPVEEWSEAAPTGLGLRSELSVRNLNYATTHKYQHDRTDGEIPSILFGCDEQGRHGNFHPDSYRSICAVPSWAKRLEKVHTAWRRARVRANWSWKELDCSNSSDALLMNIFCYPQMTALPAVRALLGNESLDLPVFGFKPHSPLLAGRSDNTEIDMKLGRLLVEAKLTESDYQVADPRLVHRYPDFEAIFDSSELPMLNGRYLGYQLIRGVLAASVSQCCFCVFCDARRPDLIELWYRVMRAVRPVDLRCQLKILTWQELARALPSDLQHFLATKYGIFG